MPSVFVQGRPADSYPPLAPEARRGKVRRITEVGEEILHKPCRDVTEFGPDLAALIDDMFLTMYVADGAGLAANQVDVDLRLFVYDCPDDDGVRHVGHIVNPVLDPLDPTGRRLLDDGWRISGSSDVWIGSEREATNPLFSVWCCVSRSSFAGAVLIPSAAM